MKLKAVVGLLGLLSLFMLAGCATSTVKPSHSLYAGADEAHANVYFYRPVSQRTRGVADYDIKLEANNELVMNLSAGEYVLVRFKPVKDVNITLRNMTYIAAKPMPEEVWRARRFTFEAGKTYFIEAKLTIEEFRGIYYKPVEVDAIEAKTQIARLKPAGELTKAEPIGR